MTTLLKWMEWEDITRTYDQPETYNMMIFISNSKLTHILDILQDY